MFRSRCFLAQEGKRLYRRVALGHGIPDLGGQRIEVSPITEFPPPVEQVGGKGTGLLRKAIHQRLKQLKYVKNFRLGTFGEGEDGVTIVSLE